MFRRTLLLTFLLTGCAQPVAQPPVAAVAATPGYRLQSLSTGAPGAFSVLGVAPPVSAVTYLGDRFMVRPNTHEVLHIDAQGDVTAWGGLGIEPGRFNQPSSLAVSVQHVFVADTDNHRVQVFDFKGKPVAQWGAFGTRAGQFVHPRAVEVAADGQVVVTDDFRVQYFKPDGTFVVDVPIALAHGAPGAQAEDAERRDAAIASIQALRTAIDQDLSGLTGQSAASYRSDMAERLAEAAAPQLQTGVPFASAVVKASMLQLLGTALPNWRLAQVSGHQQLINRVGGTSQSVSGSRAAGVTAIDVQGMDLETALMMVQQERAKLLDAQLQSQLAEVQARNDQIAKLNDLLSELNRIAATLGSDAKADALVFTEQNQEGFPEAEIKRIHDLARAQGVLTDKSLAEFKGFTKLQLDTTIQRVKEAIDSQSSSQQMDMLRLQSMSNKRNEAFDVMTNFVKKMQESRSSIVGNMR